MTIPQRTAEEPVSGPAARSRAPHPLPPAQGIARRSRAAREGRRGLAGASGRIRHARRRLPAPDHVRPGRGRSVDVRDDGDARTARTRRSTASPARVDVRTSRLAPDAAGCFNLSNVGLFVTRLEVVSRDRLQPAFGRSRRHVHVLGARQRHAAVRQALRGATIPTHIAGSAQPADAVDAGSRSRRSIRPDSVMRRTPTTTGKGAASCLRRRPPIPATRILVERTSTAGRIGRGGNRVALDPELGRSRFRPTPFRNRSA